VRAQSLTRARQSPPPITGSPPPGVLMVITVAVSRSGKKCSPQPGSLYYDLLLVVWLSAALNVTCAAPVPPEDSP